MPRCSIMYLGCFQNFYLQLFLVVFLTFSQRLHQALLFLAPFGGGGGLKTVDYNRTIDYRPKQEDLVFLASTDRAGSLVLSTWGRAGLGKLMALRLYWWSAKHTFLLPVFDICCHWYTPWAWCDYNSCFPGVYPPLHKPCHLFPLL